MRGRLQQLVLSNIRIIGVVGAMLLVLSAALVGYIQENPGTFIFMDFLADFYTRFGIELGTIVIIVLVLDSLSQRRAAEQEKQALILQMSSPENAFALEAVRLLWKRQWLMDGTLHGAVLTEANLAGANLVEASLVGVNLVGANLSRADLIAANLSGATLVRANLYGANLVTANLSGAGLSSANLGHASLLAADLSGATLVDTNLANADLTEANLAGANLRKANLRGACLYNAHFDTTTVLPDQSQWTPETDLTRFGAILDLAVNAGNAPVTAEAAS